MQRIILELPKRVVFLRSLGVQQSPLYRDHHRLRPVVRMQFKKNLFDVHLDGVVCHKEQICDLLIAFPLRDKTQHFDLSLAQLARGDVLSQLFGGLRRQKLPPATT
jgi:hypothetical protein